MARPADLILIFETHATSLDNELGLASGWYDVDISEAGQQQAKLLGERRRRDDLAAIFTSDLRRAWRTAEIAFGERGLPIVVDPRLRECDYGSLSRQSAAEIEALRAPHLTDPFPDGESYEQVVSRVASWLDETAPAHGGRTVLVIGHRATFYALEHLVAGVPLRDAIAAEWRWEPGWTYRVPANTSFTKRGTPRAT